MHQLAVNFSIALICIIGANTMIGTIFTGLTNSVFKYLVTIVIAATAILIFGYVAADIAHIIVNMK